MEEKILKIREEIINKLNKVEDGMHIKLNYESRINEAILFKTGDNECIVNQFGNRKQCAKYFALPKDILNKIDFSNIDFANFNAVGYEFNGLYNIKLNPQTIWEKKLMGAKLNGVEFIGPFDDVTLNKRDSGYITDFTGSKGAIIDVSKINKLYGEYVFLNDCIFKGVTFTSPFKCLGYTNIHGYRMPINLQITGSDFTGSRGAIIDLKNVNKESNLDSCNFTDSTVIDIDGRKRLITEDGKITHEFLYELDEALGMNYSEELESKEELEKARIELIKKRREELFSKINEVVNLTKSLEMLGIEPTHLYGTIPITEDLLLVHVDDHLEINRNIIDASLIRFFNLSLINFNNVKVSGIDFRKSKAKIDPHIVYNKDISNCIFDDFNISPFTNFEGVITDNADFSECSFEVNIKKKSI